MPFDASPFKLDLARMVKRPSRRPIVLSNTKPTQAQADDLARIYLPVITAWQAGIPRILAEYERTVAAMTTDSPSDTQGAIDGVAAEVQRLVILLTPDLRRWALRVEEYQRRRWVGSVLSATDIDLNTVLTAGDVSDTVEASISWNAALVRDVSSETQKRIANAVFAGFQRRAPAAEISKEIAEATGMARARARRIAADQTVKLGSQLNRARRLQAGIGQYKWRHSAKRHPRLWHEARNGKVFKNDDPRIPADDRCGIPPFCGCSEQAVITFENE